MKALRLYLASLITLSLTNICAKAQNDTVKLSVTLTDVEITGTRYTSKVKSHADGHISIDMGLMSDLPRVLGNADPIHYSQMLPEIQTNGEYRGGVNIQGCESSHNLISIGGVPVYNVSHLLGFFSTFNASHFEGFSITKMCDAKSANRIGGEFTMDLPSAIPESANGEFSIGLISSQGTIRYPINSKTLLAVSARSSYINLLYDGWLSSDGMDIDYRFTDLNLTLIHQHDAHHTFVVDYFGGNDIGGFNQQTFTARLNAQWGNRVLGGHHKYQCGDFRLNNTFYLTSYHNDFCLQMQDQEYRLPSGITDFGYSHKAKWKNLSWGMDFIRHDIRPQSLQTSGTIVSASTSNHSIITSELSAFTAYRYPFTQCLYAESGLRGNAYGSDDTGFLFSVDPSVSITYNNNYNLELCLNYALKHQYLMQTGFSDVGLPTEFWLSADHSLKPQYGHSFNIGTSLYLFARQFRLSTNLFYKQLYHQVEYFGSILDFVNTQYDLAAHLLQGEGQNYGFSVLIDKCAGKLTGWASYTYTHAQRRFKGLNDDNETFAASHERPHEVNAVLTYDVNRHWSVGSSFVYASGTPFTAVQYLAMINSNIISHYGRYNGNRLAPYCRWDISVNYKWQYRLEKECGLNLSLYNATRRNNELFYYISAFDDGKFSYRPRSFIVDILPSISYYCKF